MSEEKRFYQSKEVFNQLFGELPDPNKETDHELMEILRKFIFGDIFHTGNLDVKTRELITITILATLQTLPQLTAHINGALNDGASPIEIREVMYGLAPFIGFPRTLNAVNTMNEAFKTRNIELPLENMRTVTDETRYEKGFNIQNQIYGDEIKEKYPDVPEIPKFLTEFGFGDFYTRNGLDIKTRELLVLVILTTIRSDTQIKVHVLGNLKVGNTKETLISAIIQCIPYVGFPNSMNTINIIQSIET